MPAATIIPAGAILGVAAAASGPLALGAAAALLFVAVAWRDPALGLCIFIVVTFFDRSTGLQSGGITVVKGLGAALTLIWLVRAGSGRRDIPLLERDRPSLILAALLLVGWTFASALWAPDPQRALTGSGGSAFRLAQGVLLLFVVTFAVSRRKHVWWVVRAFIGGAVVAAALGFFGVYGRSASVNDARLSGGFDDPNELAAVLVPAIVLSAFAFLALGRKATRWIYVAAAVFLGYSFFQTDSQAGLVALGVASLLGVAFAGRARPWAIAGVLASVLVLATYYTFVTAPVAIQTITSQDNVSGRESLWSVAAAVVKDHPLRGVGAGNFVVVEPSYAASDLNLPRADLVVRPELVHNSYLQVTAEMGIVGLACFLSVIGCCLFFGGQAARMFERGGDWESEMLSRGVVIGSVALLTAYFFATNQYEKQLWLVLALGPALNSVARRERLARTPNS